MRLKFLGKKLSNVQFKGVSFKRAGDEREMVEHDAQALMQIHPDEFESSDRLAPKSNKQLKNFKSK